MNLKEIKRFYAPYVGYKFYTLLILQFFSAVVESVGLTLLLPLLSTLDNSGREAEKSIFEVYLDKLNLPTEGAGLVIIIVSTFLIKAILLMISGWYESRLTSRMEYKVRKDIALKVAGTTYHEFTKNNSGHYLNLIIGQIRKAVVNFSVLVTILSSLIYASIFLLIASYLQLNFTLMVVIFGSSGIWLFRYIGIRVKKISIAEVKTLNILNQLTIQFLSGFKYLKSTAKDIVVLDHMTQLMSDLRSFYFKKKLADAFSKSVTEPILVTILFGSIVISIYFFDAQITSMLVAIVLIYRALTRVMKAQSNWQAFMSVQGAILLVMQENERLDGLKENSGDLALKDDENLIVNFNNVTFSYDGLVDVLDNISFSLSRNEMIAIVGGSGSGKSTILDLITAIYKPNSGEVSIMGVDTKSLDLRKWRESIGYVTQDSLIFDDTLMNNISLWADLNEGSKEKLDKAINMANARDFIAEKEFGLEDQVGDRGVKLSGGQKQRVSIARELFKSPRLLILDEATSALDTFSEEKVKESINSLKGKLTTIIVAHRLSTIKDVDKVLVLEEGRVVEYGAHDELVLKKGKFYEMLQSQQSDL